MVLTTYIILFVLPMLALLAFARNVEAEGLLEMRDAVAFNVVLLFLAVAVLVCIEFLLRDL